MSTLILGFHIIWTPAREAAFRKVLPPGEYTFRSEVVGTGGTAYEFYAKALRERNAGIWAGVMKELGGNKHDKVLLLSWSAGYGFVRELAKEFGSKFPDNLMGYVALDSIYGPSGADPTPWVAWATAAKQGKVALIIGASEVETPGYASTRDMSESILRAVGLPMEIIPPTDQVGYPRYSKVGAYGCLVALWIDGAPGKGTGEHVAALDTWGAALTTAAWSALPPELPRQARLIDTSHWQATMEERKTHAPAVDASKARSVGVCGVISRATYGMGEDENFRATWEACRREGLVRGAYAFPLPKGYNNAPGLVTQADKFLEVVGPLGDDDFMVVDIEPPPGLTALAWSHLITQEEWNAWSERVITRSGKTHLTYCGRWCGFWSLPTPLWVPYYRIPRSEVPWPSPSELPKGWSEAIMYQWTERFAYPGENPLDANVFRGSEDELRAFLKGLKR